MKKKLIALAILVAVIAVPVAIKFSGSKPKIEAELAKVENKEIHPSILASGNLVFRQEVNLSPEVIGKVSEVLIKEGDKVEKGQVLLRLDPSTYKADVAQQEASLRNASVSIERAQFNVDNQQRNLERMKRLAADKFIDQSKLDEVKHQVDLANVELRGARETYQQVQALLTQARERLFKTEVKAPISGTATSVSIKVGETAVSSATGIAGSSLATIADISSMIAEVNVDEGDIARVTPGLTAKVFPSAFVDKPITGTVDSVSLAPKSQGMSAATGSQGRSYVVKLRLADNQLALRTGMTCRVEIVTGSGGAKPVVPVQAVQLTEASGKEKRSNYVYVIDNGVAKKRTVEVGISDDTNQEVTKGLALGDTVAVGPARVLRELREGDQVSAKAEAKGGKPAGAKP